VGAGAGVQLLRVREGEPAVRDGAVPEAATVPHLPVPHNGLDTDPARDSSHRCTLVLT